jgi:glycosyltransferase involved in cell wall biosynthesis
MKRILIEANTVSAQYCGLKEFIIQLGTALAARAPKLRNDHNVELAFIVPPAYQGCFGPNVSYVPLNVLTRAVLRHVGCLPVDLFHAPHQYCKLKSVAGARHTLLTIHDINFIYEKQGESLNRGYRRLQWRLDHADHLSFISQFAYDDTRTHFNIDMPHRIIYNGVTNLSGTATSSTNLETIPKRFFFHISSLLAKKNVHLLIEMMRYLPDEHLVIAGTWQNDSYGQALKKAIAQSPHHNITTLDRISEQQKAELYARCSAFMFPSLCEGFGLPPLEAMSFGKPVFLSTLTSLPEVGGNEAFYWPDLNPEAMAAVVRKGMAAADADHTLASRLQNHVAQFTWDNSADSYIDYYLSILGE